MNQAVDFPDLPSELDRRPKVPFGQLIGEYLSLREFRDAESKRLTEHLRPVNERMQAIENTLLGMLIEQKLDNASEHGVGTCYKQTSMSPKVENRDTFLDFCLDKWDEIGSEMLQVHAPQVDALRNYIDKEGKSPPGVSVEYRTKVQVRKA